jgi:GNAT superfamily N-acetyltransferase
MTTQPAYRFELMNPRSPKELEDMSALLRVVFPKATHLTPRYLDWKYAGNPDGEAVGCNAYAGDHLVGHMSATVMSATMDGENRPGIYLMNGAIHPDHRGRKLQSRISDAMFEEAPRRGFTYCFGTGNRYSTGPLLTRFKLLRPLDAWIGIGGPLRSPGPPRASFERIWSEEALRWRLANPEQRYKIACHCESATILAPTHLPGVDAILYTGADRWGLEGQGKPQPLRLWLGLDPATSWQGSRYVSIPQRLRRSPMNLVFKDLTGGGFLPDPDRLVFRALDMDFY